MLSGLYSLLLYEIEYFLHIQHIFVFFLFFSRHKWQNLRQTIWQLSLTGRLLLNGRICINMEQALINEWMHSFHFKIIQQGFRFFCYQTPRILSTYMSMTWNRDKRGVIVSLRCTIFNIHWTCVKYLLHKVFISLDKDPKDPYSTTQPMFDCHNFLTTTHHHSKFKSLPGKLGSWFFYAV